MESVPIRLRVSVLLAAAFGVLLGTVTVAGADDFARYWPSWRGPVFNGTSETADPPLRWSESNNIAWKIPVPGRGLASPVVWDDLVFLLTSVSVDPDRYKDSQAAAAQKLDNKEWPPDVKPVKQRFVVVAVQRATGEVIWQKTAFEVVPHESH